MQIVHTSIRGTKLHHHREFILSIAISRSHSFRNRDGWMNIYASFLMQKEHSRSHSRIRKQLWHPRIHSIGANTRVIGVLMRSVTSRSWMLHTLREYFSHCFGTFSFVSGKSQQWGTQVYLTLEFTLPLQLSAVTWAHLPDIFQLWDISDAEAGSTENWQNLEDDRG